MRTLRLACCALTLLLLAGAPSISDARGGKGLPLTPEAVVPSPGEAGASATISVNPSRSEVCFSTTIGKVSGWIETIAIYKGDVGQVGPMVVRLCPSQIGINQLIGCVPVDGAICRDLARNPSSYFVQINSNQYPGGAVRAQLR